MRPEQSCFVFSPSLWRTGSHRRPHGPDHRSWQVFSVASCGASGLAGCASPHGFLEPVAADAPGTSHVEMVVATTRTRADACGNVCRRPRWTPELRRHRRLNSTRRLAPNRRSAVAKAVPGNPATDFVTLKADIIDRPQAIATFSRLVKNTPKRQVLVFVHGFNNRFEDAVFRFAQFIHDSGRATSRPSSSPGRRGAVFLPMVMTVKAPTTLAMRSKTFCAGFRKILRSKK